MTLDEREQPSCVTVIGGCNRRLGLPIARERLGGEKM